MSRIVSAVCLFLLFHVIPASAQTRIITGRVTDSTTGEVVTSAQLSVSGTTVGTTTRGAPGGGSVVNLRGVTSIIGKFTPLYVVDGVIVSDAAIPPGTNLLTKSYGNGLSIAGVQDNPVNRIADLNPDNVESVEV